VTLHLEAAGITHRGTVRENNEDCLAIGYWTSQASMDKARHFEHSLEIPFVCVVADGMGGHNDGERASLLVAKSLARRLPAFGHEKIASSVRAANAELYSFVREYPELAGMGSTCVGLAVHDTHLTIFNVGDSRAYRLHDSKLLQLSTDDSLIPNWKPGAGIERSNKLLQCFGGRASFTDVEPHLLVEPCLPGSTYLLCCDGLYETLPEEQIVALIGDDILASCEALLGAALDAKAKDNVTVALVRVSKQ